MKVIGKSEAGCLLSATPDEVAKMAGHNCGGVIKGESYSDHRFLIPMGLEIDIIKMIDSVSKVRALKSSAERLAASLEAEANILRSASGLLDEYAKIPNISRPEND